MFRTYQDIVNRGEELLQHERKVIVAKIAQTVEYDNEEISNILREHAKKDLSEAGGKQLQGSAKVHFNASERDGNCKVAATVSFERAGK